MRGFRESLECDMVPERWTELIGPMVLLLADVCDALRLDERERASVLGVIGEEALAGYVESRSVSPAQRRLNERQTKALAHARYRGSINLGAYRQLCPDWSDETLRRDLVDLAQRGLLAKNGAKRGTYYTRAA
ncbi:unnamed protein product [marine sediment metagenome]|uniref:HTH deoR-type domain-containing protein n=1 Tax=marine sediment metagenome TaxID=412755 RepID=X0V7P3_9ZZZZ